MRFDAHYPIVSGYARQPAFGYYIHVADPLQFRQLSASVAYSPFKVKGAREIPRQCRIPDAQLEAAILAQSRRRLRPRRAGAAQPQGRRLHRQLLQARDLRPAAPARRVRLGRGLFRARAAARRAEHPQPARTSARPRSACATPTSTHSQGGVDREKGFAGAHRRRRRRGARASSSPSSTAGSTSAPRCPGATARPGSTPMPASPAASSISPLAAYYFGSFRNNYVDDRPVKRYRELESMPGLRDRRDRRAPLRQG